MDNATKTANNARHDNARVQKILSIRAAARGTTVDAMLQGPCPTCCRARRGGYFRADARGYAVEGCVDAHHAGAYIGERARFWARPAAQEIRRAMLESLPLSQRKGSR